MRQVSKCSLEAPGGTSDDLSIVSLSEILAEDHNLEIFAGFQGSKQQKLLSRNVTAYSEDEDVLTLADVVIEEKNCMEQHQSAPQIPVSKHISVNDESSFV